MPLEFTDLNSPLVVELNCDNRKLWRPKNGTERGLKNEQKILMLVRKKTMTKWKTNLKSIKCYNVSSYYGQYWKVISIFLIITVITEIRVKMIVMRRNKDKNK